MGQIGIDSVVVPHNSQNYLEYFVFEPTQKEKKKKRGHGNKNKIIRGYWRGMGYVISNYYQFVIV